MVEAKQNLAILCPKCQNEPFEEINDVFSYNFPQRFSKLNDPENLVQIDKENEKAKEFLKEYFGQLYPGKNFN